METISKTRAVGGSLVVTIPKIVVEEEGLVENQIVSIDVKKVKKSGFGILKGMRSFTKKDELDTEL